MTDLIQSENLEQLTVEIKFYVNQWGQNTIEVGKRLIAAKKLVEHGDWSKWLEDNFNLTQQTARNFMRCAERFGNSKSILNLNSTQMIQLLSLPAEETEKFIAAKKAENNPVEDMTVKNLRDEVAKWKADYEQKKSEVENLFVEQSSLQSTVQTMQKNFDKLTSEKNSLEQQLKNQKPIEKLPDDYEPMKKELAELQDKISQLEKKPIEIQFPADYERDKKELAELKIKLAETAQRTEIFQKIDTVCLLWKDIFQSKIGSAIFAEYEKVKKKRYDEFVGSMTDFLRNNNLL